MKIVSHLCAFCRVREVSSDNEKFDSIQISINGRNKNVAHQKSRRTCRAGHCCKQAPVLPAVRCCRRLSRCPPSRSAITRRSAPGRMAQRATRSMSRAAVPRTGTYAVQGEDELKGWQLAVEHINSGDPLLKKIAPKVTKGLLGKKVNLLAAD